MSMKTMDQVIKALRCTSAVGITPNCGGCPYYAEEKVPEDIAEQFGCDAWAGCDVDQICIDAAEMLEAYAHNPA